MKYFCREEFEESPHELTKHEFWQMIFNECMFGGQKDVDNMEKCMMNGQRYIGSIHMFWIEKE